MDYSLTPQSGNALSERIDRDLQRRRDVLWRLKANESRISPVPRSRRHRRSSSDDDPAAIISHRVYVKDTNHQLNPYLQFPPQHAMVSSLQNSAITVQPTWLNIPPIESGKHIKSDLIDLMMLQNAQLHQLMTQQMALSYLSPETSTQSTAPRKKSIHLDDLLKYLKRRDYGASDINSVPHWLPPVTMPTVLYYESQPLKPPKDRRRSRPVSRPLPAPVHKPKFVKKNPQRGESRPLKRFRRVALAVLFAVALDKSRRSGKPYKAPQLNETFLFGIRLREAIATMHNTWLKPQKKISKILRRTLDDERRNFTVALQTNAAKSDLQSVYQELAVIIENTIYEMTETMPTTGVLGTNRKSTVYRMMQPGQRYPRGYFWQMEKDLLKINFTESLEKISDSDASILLVGLFLGRGVITSLLLRPKEFHVLRSNESLARRSELNLKILASLFLHLLRKFYSSAKATKALVAIPDECKEFLYEDRDLTSAVNNLKKSFDYSEQLLTDWSTNYTKRLRAIF